MAGPRLLVQRTSSQAQGRKLVSQLIGTSSQYHSVYTPGEGVYTLVKRIYLARLTNGSGAWSMRCVDDGESASNRHNLFLSETSSGQRMLKTNIYMHNGDEMLFNIDTADKFVVTLYGLEVQMKAR